MFLLRAVLRWRPVRGEGSQETHAGSFPPELQPAADRESLSAGEAPGWRSPEGVREALRLAHQTDWWEERPGVRVQQQRGTHSGTMDGELGQKDMDASERDGSINQKQNIAKTQTMYILPASLWLE